jgi:Tol biopolymer transport system component
MQLHRLAPALFGFVMLASGCHDSTGPTTGAILVIVSTAGAGADFDPDGYILNIDGGPDQFLAINAAVNIADLPTGNHLVQLRGLAPNCSVNGTNPRSVDVGANGNVAASLPVNFFVSCVPKIGSIQVSAATSGPDPDPDGYSVRLTEASNGHLPANGSLSITGIVEGPVGVELTEVSANCVVDGPNPRTVAVTFGATVEVAFVIRCVQAGSLRVTAATTGVDFDASGYTVDIRLQGGSSATRAAVATNGTVTISGLLPGSYLLTLFDVTPNCQAVMPSTRAAAVAAGSETAVTLDVRCDAATQLAFVVGTDINAEIYVIASNSADASRLTTHLGSDADPAWSPDGSRIAFASGRDVNLEIYVMNANGESQTRLTNVPAHDYGPAWSPDGARIAFVSERDGNAEIYVMNADGASPVRLTSNVARDADPAWSPDGSRIAFSSDRDGSGGIWIMNANGSGLTRVTSNSRGDRQPAWSSDGTKIAFSRVSSNSSDILVVNTDGSGLAQLTEGIDNAADPAWSPDGRKIALTAMEMPTPCGWYDDCGPHDPYIMIVSADGTPDSPLTTPLPAVNPTWRP